MKNVGLCVFPCGIMNRLCKISIFNFKCLAFTVVIMLNFENSVFTKRRIWSTILENDRRSCKSRSKYAKSHISNPPYFRRMGAVFPSKNLFSQDAQGCKEQGSDAGFVPPKEGKPKTSPPPISDRLIFRKLVVRFLPKTLSGRSDIWCVQTLNFDQIWRADLGEIYAEFLGVLWGLGAKFHQPVGN